MPGVNRKNRSALAKDPRVPVVGALTLWIQNQNASMAKTKISRSHCRNQIGVGIENDDANEARQSPHESLAKDFTGSECKRAAKQMPRQYSRHYQWIDIALVIGTKQEGTLLRQIF